MPQTYIHSPTVIEINEGTSPARPASTSVIGLVAYASNAKNSTFPEGLSLHVGGIRKIIKDAGDDGTLALALDGIADQTDATVIVSRIKNVTDTTQPIPLEDKIAAVNELRYAEATLGVEPNILGAPGIDFHLAVCHELIAVAEEIEAFAYINGNATELADVMAFRDNFGKREAMLVEGKYQVINPNSGNSVPFSPVAAMLGLRALVDAKIGWHACISNHPLNGVVGLRNPRTFAIGTANSEVNLLNSKEVTSHIRREGIRPYGCRTLAPKGDPFAFESATRTAQFLKKTMRHLLMQSVDRPMTPKYLKYRLEELNSFLRTLVAQGRIYGGEAWISNEDNSKEQLKDGQYFLRMKYTPIPPAEQPHLYQQITDEYLIDIAGQVAAA